MNTPIYDYVATKRDFLNAQRLHRSNRLWVAVSYWLCCVVVPAASVLYLLVFTVRWHLHSRSVSGGEVVASAMALYLALLFPFARWWQIRKLWNQVQPAKYRGKPVTFQFDDEQVISGRPGRSEGRFFWTAIEDYAEDDRLSLLYVGRKLFLFIPKRAMPEGEWARLRALALQQGKAGK